MMMLLLLLMLLFHLTPCCTEGHKGPMCAMCVYDTHDVDKRYFRDSQTGECVKCGEAVRFGGQKFTPPHRFMFGLFMLILLVGGRWWYQPLGL